MKQILSSALILFSLWGLVSCGVNSYKYGTSTEPSQKSNLTFGMVKSKIEKGKTTQAEILELFGSPNLIAKNRSNDEVWSYNKMSVQSQGGRTDFLMGTKASTSTSSQSFDLIVTFDENNIVKDFSVVSTSF